MRNHFPNIKFIFANHVEWPIHMSAQVLPYETKQIIEEHINNYDFGEYSSKVPFYVSHMLEKDLWKTQGSVFMNYLDDLDAARKVNWNYSFKEMELEKHDPRVN
jgi:hypothetical protein